MKKSLMPSLTSGFLLVLVSLMFSPVIARAQWATSSTHIYNTNSGNVGIGTASPGSMLDVAGNIRMSGAGTLSGYGGVEFANVAGYGLKAASLQYGLYGADGTTNYLTILSGGNTGIGTVSPGGQLDIGGTNVSRNLLGFTVSSFGDIGKFTYDTSNPYPLILTMGFGRPFGIMGGNVGIGTVSPGYKLDVVGDVKLRKADAFVFQDPNDSIRVDDSPSWLPSRANVMSFKAYSANLSSSGAWAFVDSGSSNAVRVLINGDGNVGIGTTSPSQKLDVAGNIKLSGNIVSDGDICIGVCP